MKLADVQPCETCRKELEPVERGSACACLLATMVCAKCGKSVDLMMKAGMNTYPHGPCGVVVASDCFDPRLPGI